MHLDQIQESVLIPEGASASVAGSLLTVKGEKGEITRKIGSKTVLLEVKDGKLTFTVKNATRNHKRVLRTGKSHATNMLRGVTEGITYKLKICSGHFPMSVSLKDNTLEVKNFIGEKVPRTTLIKEGCDVSVDGDIITVSGCDKELVGNQAAKIELLMRRPGFDKRIFQDGIYLIEKDSKVVGQ